MDQTRRRPWRKSSYTGNDNCVELCGSLDRVRDSKQRDNGPELMFPPRVLAAFLAAVKTGRLDG
ncbi:DUF397 domain-containing protein [Saccharothrix texasensis]|uniref:Uncharacterized protein DUF397 n=1 Tax=Saccharothrix texasensis TaxID=103734 RepID=A0A3N1H1M8_9PSEU|nr:DUF397 domain-containing protein [Saccharothrix texasensis]ROP36306.1 uncharacterized protein DUF397 [Saccharothrix texasensis]